MSSSELNIKFIPKSESVFDIGMDQIKKKAKTPLSVRDKKTQNVTLTNLNGA